MFAEADTLFIYPSCFKTMWRWNLSGSGQKRRARKAQRSPALEFHNDRVGEKSVPRITLSKQYFWITFLCLHSFKLLLKEAEKKYLLDSNVETNNLLSQYNNIPVPTCNRGKYFLFFLCKGDNAINNFCTSVTVCISVSETKASSNGLCMTPYNMALANFLCSLERGFDYFSDKFYGYWTSGWIKKGNEQDRGGSYWAFGHAGIHK